MQIKKIHSRGNRKRRDFRNVNRRVLVDRRVVAEDKDEVVVLNFLVSVECNEVTVRVVHLVAQAETEVLAPGPLLGLSSKVGGVVRGVEPRRLRIEDLAVKHLEVTRRELKQANVVSRKSRWIKEVITRSHSIELPGRQRNQARSDRRQLDEVHEKPCGTCFVVETKAHSEVSVPMVRSVRMKVVSLSTKDWRQLAERTDMVEIRRCIAKSSQRTNVVGAIATAQVNNLRAFAIHFANSAHNLAHRPTHSAASERSSGTEACRSCIATRHFGLLNG